MTVIVKHGDDDISYRIYLDNIGAATISSATFEQWVAAPTSPESPDLEFGSSTPDNTTTPKSVIVDVSGGEHGKTYIVHGSFTLSTGGPVVRSFPIRVVNS